ncbi:unnamed protein product, partial [Mesorhabditis belari]|uniref:Uncharacterized protein n=1 Tax=Mesorhabditis belari TaxID=2138241 RepID=A0AAF3J8G8_9BILA
MLKVPVCLLLSFFVLSQSIAIPNQMIKPAGESCRGDNDCPPGETCACFWACAKTGKYCMDLSQNQNLLQPF